MNSSTPAKVSDSNTIILPLHQKFKEKPPKELGPIRVRKIRGWILRLIVISLLIIFIITVTTLGGYLFLYVEQNHPPLQPDVFNGCFEKGWQRLELGEFSTNETLKEVQKCILSATSIEQPKQSFLYTWGLYSTVGYGDRFTHSRLGRILSLVFAWLFVPCYMALKTEFGEVLALCILKCGRVTAHYVKTIAPSILKKPVSLIVDKPSDIILALLLTFIFVSFSALTAFVIQVHSHLQSQLIQISNGLSFFNSFYLTMYTVMLIGLGDLTPNADWINFLVILPMFLCGDAIFSYLNYYTHGICRIYMHRLAMTLTGAERDQTGEVVQENMELGPRDSVVDFPPITTNIMPLRRKKESRFSMPAHHVKSYRLKGIDEPDLPLGSIKKKGPE